MKGVFLSPNACDFAAAQSLRRSKMRLEYIHRFDNESTSPARSLRFSTNVVRNTSMSLRDGRYQAHC